ncbi:MULTISPECIES: Ger(x)C family spore germination protein [unclassified Paenibacillus]|uniref:Ger(x)C family spore germination protein n=1 Tax=unclassified Paenibacillus TaxID=185978 RepID=UPI0008381848|nr:MULTISPECIES: Ger(x)C family spore germination protein [unclassified Paenibacillus]
MTFRCLKKIAILLLILSLTGCWDRLEIENRIFVLAVAIDKVAKKEGKILYELTIQVAEPKALSGKSPPTDIKPVWNVSVTGYSIFDCMRSMATEVARIPFYEHLQVIVISEELAKEGIAAPMDLFLRDHELRRKTNLVVAPGQAKDVLDINHKLIPVPGVYLSMLTQESVNKTSKMPQNSTVDTFSVNFRANRNTLLTKVEPREDHVIMQGGAILNKDKFAGWLNSNEVRSYQWVIGTVRAGNYLTVNDKENQVFTTFEVKNMRSIIKPHIRNGDPYFTIRIIVEGNIGEDSILPNSTPGDLRKIEQMLNQNIRHDADTVIQKLQKEIGLDIFGFGEQLRRHKYAYWKQHEQDWENLFRTVDVNVEVETSIRRIGHVK